MKPAIWVTAVVIFLIGVSLGSGKKKNKPAKRKPVLIDSVKVDSLNIKIYLNYGKED